MNSRKSKLLGLALAAAASLLALAGPSAAVPYVTDSGIADEIADSGRTKAISDSVGPSAVVLAPNTYQLWGMGTIQRITWSATDDRGVASVDLEFSADSGATWSPIAATIPNAGFFDWTVPFVRTNRALVQVTARDSAGNTAQDRSDATFEIKDRQAPAVTVTSPNGGETWLTGSVQPVTWNATDNVGVVRVDLSYSPDGGATWRGIVSRLANTGSYSWTLPMNVATSQALFKAAVVDSAGNSTSDVSNAAFTIRDGAAPVMTVTTPNGGEIWDVGLSRTLTWKATDNIRVTSVDLEYTADSGSTWIPIAAGLSNSGKHVWTVPGTPTTRGLFRATARDSMGNWGADLGNGPFTIRDLVLPTATVLAPNGGEVVTAGSVATVTWSAADDAGIAAIDLEYSPDGVQWLPIAAGIANTGSRAWTVPLAPSTQARVRVVARDLGGNVAVDASDAPFEVRAAGPVAPGAFRKFLSLRADSASGTGPYPAPGHENPWVDLVGSHDGTLVDFRGTRVSGWAGDGAPGNPRRLEFAGEEPGWNSRVVIPGGSVPELQTIGPLSAAVWFRTGYDGPAERYEYVLEWVQRPAEPFDPEYEGRGMSIVVQNGRLQVYANPWIDVGEAAPNTWYHVAVVKDTNDMRIYVNGARIHTGIKSHRGLQESEIAIGASIFRRFEGRIGDEAFGDFFTGAVAQVDLWEGTLGDSAVVAVFRADSALYRTPAPAPPDSAVVRLDAARADGTAPYANPGAASPWVDLASPRSDFALVGFDGTAASGWAGDGSAASPYRLELDGVDDAVAVDGAALPELLVTDAITVDLSFRTGADVAHGDYRYVIEWLEAFGASPGLSVMISNGRLWMYAGSFQWTDLGAVQPSTWYRLSVVKRPGSVRAFVDGALVHASAFPNLGRPFSGIVLGASTWQGPGQYGDRLAGALKSVTLWARPLSDAEIAGGAALRSAEPGFEASPIGAEALALAGPRPNPARGTLNVHFSLPGSGPAALELLDVGGRRIESRRLGELGAGRHVVRLGEGSSIRPGVYWLRLTHAGRSLTKKAIVAN